MFHSPSRVWVYYQTCFCFVGIVVVDCLYSYFKYCYENDLRRNDNGLVRGRTVLNDKRVWGMAGEIDYVLAD